MWQHHGPDRWILERPPNGEVEQRFLPLGIEVNGPRADLGLGRYLGDSGWPISMLDKDFRRCVCNMVETMRSLGTWHIRIINESCIINIIQLFTPSAFEECLGHFGAD
jgi:hypothetical protein